MGLSHSSGFVADKEAEKIIRERVLAKKFIHHNRLKVQHGLQKLQRCQQFYYTGIVYYGVSMTSFSLCMLVLRKKIPILQSFPWLIFTISGYFLGGQLWGLHQNYKKRSLSVFIDSIKDEMSAKNIQYPHLTEYRAEISSLEQTKKTRDIPDLRKSTNKGKKPDSPTSVWSFFFPLNKEEKSSNSSSPEETQTQSTLPEASDNMEDEIIRQVMERNKAINANSGRIV